MLCVFLLCGGLSVGTVSVVAQDAAWTSSTFVDFSDGTLGDGGVNTYVAADGSVRLVNLWDLNDDGNFDLPIACGQDHDEVTETLIYWSNPRGFSPQARLELPTAGAMDAAVADLNRDGHADIVIANRFDGERTNLDCYIYWGGPQGFDPSRRSELPARAARAVAIADLNGDDFPDIVLANRGVDYHMVVDQYRKSFIYWGSAVGFSAKRRTELATINCTDVAIADVNRDGFPDVAFANEGNRESESGAMIYLGNARGEFSPDRRLDLPGFYTSGIEVVDLNHDAHPEIVLANMFSLEEKPDPPTGNRVQTYRVNSYIYWGSSTGYTSESRTELPTLGAHACAAGDLNQDGLPDLVFANSSEDVSFVYWNGPRGFAPQRRSQISALHAHDVTIADLNDDNFPELVFANYDHGGFFDTNSYVYWGGPDGLDDRRRTELPTSGASAVVVADLNGDRKKDVCFVNKIEGVSYAGGTTSAVAAVGPTTSWIYWGDDQGQFDPQRRQGFPTMRSVDGFANCDLNADGHVDLVFAHGATPTMIYWGSETGFDRQNHTTVPDARAGTVRTADLDRDGYLDLLINSKIIFGQPSGFSSTNRFHFDPNVGYGSLADLNQDGWLDVISPRDNQVILHWNSPQGFNNAHTSVLELPGKHCCIVEIADLNRDRFLDLIVVNHADAAKPLRPGEVAIHHANPHVDAVVYWGGQDGYSAARTDRLPTIGPNDAVAADCNSDGYIDLFFPSYLGGVHRHFPGFLYWNGPRGFDPARKTEIPGFSGCGALVADCNLDGHQDLIVANHTIVGNHRSPTWIHWGSPTGYAADRITSLPATGAHFFSLVDIGNLYDRSDCYDYLSPAWDAGRAVLCKRISWTAETPHRTRLLLQIRTAETKQALAAARWQGPEGPDSFYTSPGANMKQPAHKHRWVQYKASLISPNSSNTPVLRSVRIDYE